MKNRTLLLVASMMMLSAMPGILAAGCGDSNQYVFDCQYPVDLHLDHNGQRDACCHIDPCPELCLNDPCPDGGSDDAASACAGTCVPVPPSGEKWEGPGLLWIGPEGTAPACPPLAPVVAFEAHDGLKALPASCGACSCSAASGSCAPPLSFTTSSKFCGDGSGMITPFDRPPAWDGSCTAKDCISPDPTCAHPMSVQSLTAAPLVMTEQGCVPSTAIAPDLGTPTWTTAVLACRGQTTSGPGCSDPDMTCPAIPSPPDFAICLYHVSDVSCPDSYPEKHLVYSDFDDQRACSACTCSAPAGGSCSANLHVFKDSVCSTPLLGSVPLSSLGSPCFDITPAGSPLGSKTVTALAYTPGSCAPSGGEPSGDVVATNPSTFCCLKN